MIVFLLKNSFSLTTSITSLINQKFLAGIKKSVIQSNLDNVFQNTKFTPKQTLSKN